MDVPLPAAPAIVELPGSARPLIVKVHEARLLTSEPWVRSLGKLSFDISTEGWRFPAPPADATNAPPDERRLHIRAGSVSDGPAEPSLPARKSTRLKPPRDAVVLKERLLYLLQPPLESLFAGKQVRLPFEPYPYQLQGIAFLMPRSAALLADEMGLGKTMQAIVALRLLFHAGLIQRALVVCPKPLVNNWSRELRSWAEDVPFEIIGGDTQARRASWLVSNCPLKLVNYEILTRDVELLADERLRFDDVVVDEAPRIKTQGYTTADAVCAIKRTRSW